MERRPHEVEINGVKYLSPGRFAELAGAGLPAVRKAAREGRLGAAKDQQGRLWIPASSVSMYANKAEEIILTPIEKE